MKVEELIQEIRDIINLPKFHKDNENVELFKNSKDLIYIGNPVDYKKMILDLIDKFERELKI